MHARILYTNGTYYLIDCRKSFGESGFRTCQKIPLSTSFLRRDEDYYALALLLTATA
jgi:hypothetical protein